MSAAALSPHSLMDVKTQRVALYVLSAILIVSGIALGTAAFSGAIVLSTPLEIVIMGAIVAELIIAGLASLYCAKSLQERPQKLSFNEELQKSGQDLDELCDRILDEALQPKFLKEYAGASFPKMIEEHSLETIAKYNLMTKENLQKKFKEEYGTFSLEDLTASYSIEEIQEYNLMTDKDLQEKFKDAYSADSFCWTFQDLEESRYLYLMPKQELYKKFAQELQSLDLDPFLDRFFVKNLQEQNNSFLCRMVSFEADSNSWWKKFYDLSCRAQVQQNIYKLEQQDLDRSAWWKGSSTYIRARADILNRLFTSHQNFEKEFKTLSTAMLNAITS